MLGFPWRLLVRRGVPQGKASFYDAMTAASAAKLVASEHCVKAVSDVLEWYGGLGTTTQYDIQHIFRVVRQAVIAEGTKKAQRMVIALQLLGRDFAAWERKDSGIANCTRRITRRVCALADPSSSKCTAQKSPSST